MSAGDGIESPSYRLIYPEAVRQLIRDLGRRAKQLGWAAEFVAALRGIERRLQSDPLEFGEPLRHLLHVDLLERHGGQQRVFVRYAVDCTRHLVYVMHCIVMEPDAAS
jgi:hypothetical protein